LGKITANVLTVMAQPPNSGLHGLAVGEGELLGVTEGDGLGEGDGDGDGLGLGLGFTEGDGEGDGLGAFEGEGDGLGATDGDGDGDGLASSYSPKAYVTPPVNVIELSVPEYVTVVPVTVPLPSTDQVSAVGSYSATPYVPAGIDVVHVTVNPGMPEYVTVTGDVREKKIVGVTPGGGAIIGCIRTAF